MAGKQVKAQDENTAVAMFSEERGDHIKDTHRGSEEVSSQDTSLPRLEMIQDLSPQRKKSEPQYIEGADSGMIFNTATQELLGEEVIVIPVFFRKEWLLWQDRKQVADGGFGGAYETEEAAEHAKSQMDTPGTWDVIDTHQHFCMMVKSDGSVTEVVISMAKTKMKPSRQWNTMIQTAGGDRFARAYRLQVVQAKNAKGSFYNWQVKQLGFVPEALYEKAEFLYDAIKGGQRDVSRNYDEGASNVADANDM